MRCSSNGFHHFLLIFFVSLFAKKITYIHIPNGSTTFYKWIIVSVIDNLFVCYQILGVSAALATRELKKTSPVVLNLLRFVPFKKLSNLVAPKYLLLCQRWFPYRVNKKNIAIKQNQQIHLLRLLYTKLTNQSV